MVNPLRGALPAGRETGSDENAHRIAQNLGNGKAHHQPGASSAWRIISLSVESNMSGVNEDYCNV
jgi:hypothetical protein